MKQFLFITTLILSQIAHSATSANLTVTVSPGFEVAGASALFVAKNDFLPHCATGYLGGGHKGKVEEKFYAINQIEEQTYVINGQVSAPFSLACQYQYRTSQIDITAKGVRPCLYMEKDPGSCVWPTSVQFNPEKESHLNISCQIEQDINTTVVCQKN